jgi:hypothetical protein
METHEPNSAPPHRPLLYLLSVVLLAVMIVALLALAWAIGARLWKPSPPAPTSAPAPDQADSGPIQVGSWTRQPLAAAGVTAVEEDPADIAPPEGARRLVAIRREIADSVSIEASYAWSGPPVAAVEHYRQAFARIGLAPQNDSSGPFGGRVLEWTGPGLRAVVVLPKPSSGGTIERIMVTSLRPRPATAPAGG